MVGDGSHPLGVGHRRAPELLHDEAHGLNATDVTRTSPRDFDAPAFRPVRPPPTFGARMGTDKRQRQKEGHRLQREELRRVGRSVGRRAVERVFFLGGGRRRSSRSSSCVSLLQRGRATTPRRPPARPWPPRRPQRPTTTIASTTECPAGRRFLARDPHLRDARRRCASTRQGPTRRSSTPPRGRSGSTSTPTNTPNTVNNFVVLARYQLLRRHPGLPDRPVDRHHPGRRAGQPEQPGLHDPGRGQRLHVRARPARHGPHGGPEQRRRPVLPRRDRRGRGPRRRRELRRVRDDRPGRHRHRQRHPRPARGRPRAASSVAPDRAATSPSTR